MATANKKDECIELKNIKYKTMLLSGNLMKETKSSSDLTNLDKFLEDNKNNNMIEPWNKLDKTMKTLKLTQFADDYAAQQQYTDEEKALLHVFLKDCLDRKRLQRVKDVEYDKTTGVIKQIPALLFNKSTNHFTLKNMDKRVNTLKGLPTKKAAKGTVKNAVDKDKDKDSDDEKED